MGVQSSNENRRVDLARCPRARVEKNERFEITSEGCHQSLALTSWDRGRRKISNVELLADTIFDTLIKLSKLAAIKLRNGEK